MMTPERAREIERLSSIVHDLYQNEVKRQGRTLRHEDDYENLSEETKELDRVFVRWHLSCVEEVIEYEREAAKGLLEAAIKAEEWFRYFEKELKKHQFNYFGPFDLLQKSLAAYKARLGKQSLEGDLGGTNTN